MEFPDLPRPARLTLPAQPLLVESISPTSSIAAVTELPDLAIAQRYQASVEDRLANGNFKVMVNGHELQMNLPANTKTGDQLNLLLVSKEPRLKFALLSATPITGSNNNATKTSLDLSGIGAELSKTGLFIGALTQDTIKSLSTPTLNSSTPILTTPPMTTQQLPSLLQQAMTISGLFYENHQAQWVMGKRTLEQLSQEPQGKILTSNVPTINSPTLNSIASNNDTPVHQQSMSLVQQQLNLLETGHLSWRGEVWAGQMMEWNIAKDPSPSGEEEETTSWQTRLRFNLPKLGEVVATIGLNKGDVRMALNATDSKTLSKMRDGQQPLAESMTAAGLNVIGMDFGTIHEKGG
jgi:hypothetical protein